MDIINQYFDVLVLSFASATLIILILLYCQRKKHKVARHSVVYEEQMQSGVSYHSILTALTGGCKYLSIKFMKDRLIIRPLFPFNAIGGFLGLDQEIPYSQIIDFSVKQFILTDFIYLEFKTKRGSEKLKFTVNDVDKVESLLRHGMNNGRIN